MMFLFAAPLPAQTGPLPQTVQPAQRFPMQQGAVAVQPMQTQPIQASPLYAQPLQAQPLQAQPMQTQPLQTQPMQAQPIQTPLFSVPGTAAPQTPPSFPMVPIANPIAPVAAPIGTIPQPVRVATANPSYPAAPVGQPTTQPPPGMMHMGHSAPANKIIPFALTPAEQYELDEFLARWEKYSGNIKQYEVDFNMFIYEPTVSDADPRRAQKTTFGYFKYIANPMRFVYEVEGEWQGNKQMKHGDKNPHIFAEKVIIDEKTIYKYDYVSKTRIKINVPTERVGETIDRSPLPLIFCARADQLKRRFSMKIVPDAGQPDRIWLQAKPLLLEDQQEFKELEILLDRRTLTAIGLRQWDINDKGHKAFEFRSPKTYNHIPDVIGIVKQWFTPTLERGWDEQVVDWGTLQPHPAMPQPPTGQSPTQPPFRHEVPLYQVQ